MANNDLGACEARSPPRGALSDLAWNWAPCIILCVERDIKRGP